MHPSRCVCVIYSPFHQYTLIVLAPSGCCGVTVPEVTFSVCLAPFMTGRQSCKTPQRPPVAKLSDCATVFLPPPRTSPTQKLREFFHNVSMQRYGEPFSEQTNLMVWSFAVAIFSVGGMIGSLSVGAIVNKFGRCARLETQLRSVGNEQTVIRIVVI